MSDESDRSNAFSGSDALQPDGPLRGIAFIGHVDGGNHKVRPTLAFTTDDTEVTALIGLGDVGEGSTLVVTWYRIEGAEQREALFSHEITVGPGGRAFSQGVAATGLAPGIYDTEATMDGHVVHSPFVVREAAGSAVDANSQAASGDEDWNVPETGDSGWSDGSEPPPEHDTSIDRCRFVSIQGGMTPIADVEASAWWSGPCTTGSLTATVAGPPMTIASSDSLGGPTPIPHLYGATWACDLPGGTDLPGTVVHMQASGSGGGSADYTLPDNGKTLTAALEGTPAAGGRVEPGNQIDIIAMAMVLAPALGVKNLTLDDGTTVIGSVGSQSDSTEAQECDPRRFFAGLTATYEVPSNPPPTIELCATALGFDGTESKDCIRYYTGEIWKGTSEVGSYVNYPGGSATCEDGWAIAFTFAADTEGAIEGQGTADLTSGPTCTFPVGPAVQHVEYLVKGERTADGFSVRFELGTWQPEGNEAFYGGEPAMWSGLAGCPAPVEVTVSGNSGTGEGAWRCQSGNPPATYGANGTFVLTCVSCEEPSA